MNSSTTLTRPVSENAGVVRIMSTPVYRAARRSPLIGEFMLALQAHLESFDVSPMGVTNFTTRAFMGTVVWTDDSDKVFVSAVTTNLALAVQLKTLLQGDGIDKVVMSGNALNTSVYFPYSP